MESPAEQSCSSQSTTSSEPLNWAMAMEVDGLSKRKSVSFVDEKLILDALNSTNSTTNGNGNGGKSTGKHNNHHHHHHQNSNGRSNGHGHSKGSSNNKSAAAAAAAATNGAKNNAVIVYYSDPQREINVDQLLTTTEPTKNGVNGSGGGGHQTNGHHRSSQNNSRGQSNGNQHHHREHQHRDNHHRDQHRHQNRQNGSGGGGDEDRRRSAVLSNGHTPSKMADNWRTKGLRMDQPQYQPVRERIGNGHHHHPGNGGHSNGHSAGKANGRGQHQPKGGMPLLQSPCTTTTGNGKVSGTFSKQQQHQQKQQQSVPPPKPSSAPITIYYTTPECSTDVIEQNLKQLQLKQKAAEASSPVADSISENTTTTEAGNGGSITLEKEGEEGEEAASRANGSTITDAFSTSSITSSATTTTTSQVNVINNDKVELSESKSESESSIPESDAKSTSDTTTTISSTAPIAAAMPITLTAGGDQYDVINGGVPIAPATLPTTGERHPIRCTLVSHPGHFYVKFVDEAGEALLSTMNEFYSLEEHLIELSVELLRPGQYFAACRKRPPTAEREWIRVQLQSVEGPDLINCLLIDEGCFGIFRCADLQPLYNQFRAVAKQAVRASLSGVIPKEIDWLPQQSLDFKKLISDRPLHSGAQVFDQAAFEEKGCLQLELYFAEKGGDGTDDDGLAGRSVAEVIVERDIASKK